MSFGCNKNIPRSGGAFLPAKQLGDKTAGTEMLYNNK